MKANIRTLALALSAASVLVGPASATTLVYADLSTATDLGFYGAGTYKLIGSGVVDLVGPVGSGFDIDPNGLPDGIVTTPGYSYFNPNGSYQADGTYGPGGSTILIGALMGTFSSTPTSGDWFKIGYGTTVTLPFAENIYAQVNDTYYPNNGGYYAVSISAVPEASTWAMALLGFAWLAFARYRNAKYRNMASDLVGPTISVDLPHQLS